MRFTKMHGLGNDYIFINGFDETVADPASLARTLSDRHVGVGGDGIVLILPSDRADFRMRIFNADGSEAENCGNALRCIARYVYERGMTRATEFAIETGAGVLPQRLHIQDGRVAAVTVTMGRPIFERSRIPMRGAPGPVLDEPLEVAGRTWRVTCLSVGNPHCVVFVEDVEAIDLPALGPAFEHHPAFPNRINTEFVESVDPRTLKLRVWERGSGITLACGTGMTAAAVAGIRTGRCERKVDVHVQYGHLTIEWPDDEAEATMTGPATVVFDGEIVP